MFGHQDDHLKPDENNDNDVAGEPEETSTGAEETQQPVEQPSEPDTQPADTASDETSTGEPSMNGVDELVVKPADNPDDASDGATDDKPNEDENKPEASASDASWQHPGTPLKEDKDRIRDVISPAGGFPQHPGYQYQSAPSNPPADGGVVANEELTGIRKQALDDLSPLVDKLDLPPEDKFRTLMMMIQSSDNQDLVKQAYEAAHSIEDEKIRAQALLDIVNEINYFTNPPPENE